MTARFNPLAELDPAAPDYVEQLMLIADALVVSDGSGKSLFFDQSARAVIAGILDYLVRGSPVDLEAVLSTKPVEESQGDD